MIPKIRHIIFDLGQVFVKVDITVFAKRFSDEFGVDPAELTHDDFNGVHRDFMVGKITGDEFHQLTCERFNHFVPLNKFKTIWESMLVGEIEGTAEIAEKLHQKNHSLALLSNTDIWHYEYSVSHFPILKKIEKNFLSYELEMQKPDAEIFKAVAKSLDAEPGECLFIDDLQQNIDGAKRVNFEAILFQNAGQLHADLITHGIAF